MEGEPTDWIKMVAIFGPVGGVIIGALLSWFQQRSSLQHSDKTRFHELRVEVYSKYMFTANKIVSEFLEGKRDDKNLDKIMFFGSQIALIASNDVRTHVVNTNATIRQMSENLPNITEYKDTYVQHTRKLVDSARSELEASTLKKVMSIFRG